MATRACAPSSPCSRASSCIRSTPSARRSRRTSWIPKLAKAEALGCFGLTEPDFGSNPGGMRNDGEEGRRLLRLERRQGLDHQRLDRRRRGRLGQARRCRSAASSSRRARRDSRPSSTRGRCRCAPRSPRSSPSRTAAIPAENILPGVEGLKGPLSCLTQARYGIAWGALGSAMATYGARSSTRRAASSGRTARSRRTSSSRSAWPG